MASELEPEVQAIDRSLLECSAEETAGVSTRTWAGTSGARRSRPRGRTRPLEMLEQPGPDGVTASPGSLASPCG